MHRRKGKTEACGALWRIWGSVARRLQVPDTGTWLAVSIGLGLLAGIGIVAAATVDPERAVWFPKCPIHHFTGLDCPGCGTARAIHALAHGAWKEAFRHNAILFVAVPFLIGIIAHPRWARSPKVAGAVFAAVVGWTVVRNVM